MKIKISFLILLLTAGFNLMAQPPSSKGKKPSSSLNPNILGRLIDPNGNPIPYASIGLFKLPDSAYVSGTASDDQGRFSFNSQKGQFLIKISFLSFKNKNINVTVGESAAQLGTIKLIPTSTNLDEVTVEADRSQMELKLDKRVFNVGKDLSNTGGNASNVLENIPSVTLDVEGNVELRGSQNVRILINGKPSGLVGVDPATALQQMPANLIDRVEVITNPSARYDAEGEVGIINIVLKKEERKGLNGSFEIQGGLPKMYGFTSVLNYRTKKINYFVSYGYNNRVNPGFGSSYQEFYNSDSLLAYERIRNHNRGGPSHTARAGADFLLNKYNTVSVSGLVKKGDGLNSANLIYRDLDINENLILETYRDEVEKEPELNYELGISHVKKFDKKGREWSTEIRFIENDETELATINETYDRALYDPLYQKTSNTEDEQNFLIQSDYVHPTENGQFEFGVKSTNRIIENDFLVEQHSGDNKWFVLQPFDNQFKYTEKIQAAYAMYSGELGSSFKFQAGLRAEYSDILTEELKSNTVNKRNYLNYFPSVHVTYKLPKSQSVQLSYSRRLSRPRFRHLLPYWGFSDTRNFMLGNPNLNPEYTNSYEIGYMKYFNKGSFLASVYHRHRTGVIQRISFTNGSGIVNRMPVNLSTQNALGLELSNNYEITSFWRFTGSLNAYQAITEGEYEGQNLSAEAYTLNGRVSTNIKILKKLNLQTSFRYDAPRKNTQGIVLARYNWDFGLSYPMLNDKATLSFTGRDILNTRRYRWETETDDFYSTSDFQWRTRVFRVSFNYRLNNYKEQRRKKQKGFDVNDNVSTD
ncbi:MAG: TonB-dependent receptor domain-containing protein [Bacteroidia bacterium]